MPCITSSLSVSSFSISFSSLDPNKATDYYSQNKKQQVVLLPLL